MAQDTWTVKQVAEQLEIGRSTVQQRADHYAWALSGTASPGKGKERRFTPKDYAILEEIERLQSVGRSHEQIEADLREDIDHGRFDTVYEFPQEPTGMVPMAQYIRDLSHAEALARTATARADKVEAELLAARERVAFLEGQLEVVRGQKGGTDEIIRLHREIARLELMLEQAQGKNGDS